MKIQHPAVTSDVFKLIAILEFDLELDGHFLPTRVELYHLLMTLPKGKTRHPESDEELLVERTWELSDKFEDFEAPSARAAMKLFLDSLKKYLKRVAD